MVEKTDYRFKNVKIEELVGEHRFTIAVFFPVVGVLLLALSKRIDSELLREMSRFPPGLILANAIMTAPLAVGILPLLNKKRTIGICFLAIFSYGIEITGVKTGFPYGEFSYESVLEPTLGGVPLALPLFWLPVLVNGFLLGVVFVYTRTHSRAATFVSATLFVVLLDTILDPGAVGLNFWSWDSPGIYYGVPLINFGGWLLSGGVGSAVLVLLFDLEALFDRIKSLGLTFDTLFAFLVFWGLVNAIYLQVIPVIASGIVLITLLTRDWYELPIP